MGPTYPSTAALLWPPTGQMITHPTASQRMKVRSANATMGDLDIDVRLFPCLGFELLPLQLTLDRVRAQAEPALELVVCLSHCNIERSSNRVDHRNNPDDRKRMIEVCRECNLEAQISASGEPKVCARKKRREERCRASPSHIYSQYP